MANVSVKFPKRGLSLRPGFRESFEELLAGTGAIGLRSLIDSTTVLSDAAYGSNDGIGRVNNFTLNNLYGLSITTGLQLQVAGPPSSLYEASCSRFCWLRYRRSG